MFCFVYFVDLNVIISLQLSSCYVCFVLFVHQNAPLLNYKCFSNTLIMELHTTYTALLCYTTVLCANARAFVLCSLYASLTVLKIKQALACVLIKDYYALMRYC